MKILTDRIRFSAAIGVAGMALAFTGPVNATCNPDAYIGSICITAANFCPEQYMEAAGQVLPINEYTMLYSLLGYQFGGDGRNTFGLPDLRGRTPVGYGTGPGLDPVQFASMRGLEYRKLTVAQMPKHNHTAVFSSGGGSSTTVDIPVSGNTDGNKTAPNSDYSYLSASPGGTDRNAAAIWSNKMRKVASVKGVTVSSSGGGGSVEVGYTGSNSAIKTIPPQLAMRYCIAVDGLYPPRPN